MKDRDLGHDDTPVDENAKTAVTKPGRVISWVCGTGRRAVAKVKRVKDRNARSKAKGTAVTKKSSRSTPQ